MIEKLVVSREYNSSTVSRILLLSGYNIGSVYMNLYKKWVVSIHLNPSFMRTNLSSKEDALVILDEKLAKLGYILLTADQADKYKLLI